MVYQNYILILQHHNYNNNKIKQKQLTSKIMERNFTNKLLKLQTLQLAMLECGIRQDAPSLEVTLHAPFPNHHRAYIFATLHYKVKGDLKTDMRFFDPCDQDDSEFNEFVTNCANIINNN